MLLSHVCSIMLRKYDLCIRKYFKARSLTSVNKHNPTCGMFRDVLCIIPIAIDKTNCLKGNAQFIFLCMPQKSSVNVCLMKILKSTVSFYLILSIAKFFTALILKNICKRLLLKMCSAGEGVLRNFAKFLGKHLCQSFFFEKVAGLRKKETLTRVFSCEFCEIFKNTFFTEHLWTTAS